MAGKKKKMGLSDVKLILLLEHVYLISVYGLESSVQLGLFCADKPSRFSGYLFWI